MASTSSPASISGHSRMHLFDVMIVECVEVDPAKDARWLARKKFFGVKLPTDEIELKLPKENK